MLEVDDLFAMDINQLKDKLISLKRDLLKLRFQKASGQLENPSRIKSMGRDIARVKTVMNSDSFKKKS
ncbi:MAG: 50S ribosomal protein L29 [Candidatus Liberibacter europaeus]|uniref:Large ribosomal subunit protein uL29 n=1 Tax=Candidatus Liberibacter europaeus TaxID=744859 RepID=A0A2T4VYK3_9HYPH|nr:50S ribosomal protein L29 [Candidatus Liberibacter europaeus]PTL86845.1 MAG: 50S ribosomal protein L29 [Candidatus Liberibacter europaeus]